MLSAPTPAPIDAYFEAADIHDVNRARGVGTGIALILALVLTVAHGLNLFIFVAGESVPVMGLLVHVILVAVTAVIARGMIVKGVDSRFLMILLITTATLSAFGAAGTVIGILLYGWHSRNALPFAEWFETMFPSRELRASEIVHDDIVIGRDESAKAYSVLPFLDVMHVGSDTQKREAISKMSMSFDPRFAPAFRKALTDDSNTIRVQAATAITRIENQFLERLMKLSELYQRLPSDPVVVLALAEHYDNYAFTGILDPDRERINRERALHYYLEYLSLMPRDEKARMAAGRVMLRNGEAVRAADWLRDCVQQGYRSDTLMVWYIESLYAAGRFSELRRLAADNLVSPEHFRAANPALAESLLLWSGRFVPATLATGGAA
jgi:hypothetical protein